MSNPPAARSPTRIVLSSLAIIVWVLVHLILFYLVFVSGFFMDLTIRMLRAIFMNDAPALQDLSLAWVTPLQIGMALTGLAGIPGGLAIFWKQERRLLFWTFLGAFVTGVLFEIYAVLSLLRAAFS